MNTVNDRSGASLARSHTLQGKKQSLSPSQEDFKASQSESGSD